MVYDTEYWKKKIVLRLFDSVSMQAPTSHTSVRLGPRLNLKFLHLKY